MKGQESVIPSSKNYTYGDIFVKTWIYLDEGRTITANTVFLETRHKEISNDALFPVHCD